MTYQKPAHITYTQMCIWIDEHAYTENCCTDTLYQYLYHLSVMIARKKGFFNTAELLDHFGLFSATRLFLRLRNPKQYATEGKSLKKIKSILNYIKTVSYPYKIDFENDLAFHEEEEIIYTQGIDLADYIIDQASLFDQQYYILSPNFINDVITTYLKKLPIKKDSAEWLNIYLSCSLSFLNSITFTHYQEKKFQNYKKNKLLVSEKFFKKLKYTKPILFHLPDTFNNYITILVNELKHVLASELSYYQDYYISSESIIKHLISEKYNKEAEEYGN